MESSVDFVQLSEDATSRGKSQTTEETTTSTIFAAGVNPAVQLSPSSSLASQNTGNDKHAPIASSQRAEQHEKIESFPLHPIQETNESRTDAANLNDTSPASDLPELDPFDQRVAYVVYCALSFFGILVVVAAVMVIVLIQAFGFLALVCVSLFVMAAIGLFMFIDKVMKEDSEWKPMRRRIRQWKTVATAVMLQEVRDFQMDLHEHLLLTDGSEFVDEDDPAQTMTGTSTSEGEARRKTRRRRGKSALFKMVKPFLRIRQLRRRRNGKQEESAPDPPTNIPPIV